MKALFLAMVLCIGAFANESNLFQDEDIDLVIQVPEELKRTWNISNSQTGFTVTVFNTGEGEEVNVMAVGKIPLNSVAGEEVIDFLPVLLEELYNNFTSQECSYILDEVDCHIQKLPPIASEVDFTHRYRIHLYLEEIEETLRMDIHLFFKNDHSCFIMTGGLDCQVLDDLDDFSEKVLSNLRFFQ